MVSARNYRKGQVRLSPSEQPDFTLALKNLLSARPPVLSAARVNRCAKSLSSWENRGETGWTTDMDTNAPETEGGTKG